MALWLKPFTQDRAVRVRALAGVIVLCSWAIPTLTVPLYTKVYKLVPANLLLEDNLQWTNIPAMEVEILLVAPRSLLGKRA